jgi:hypothetical protein
MTLLPYTLVMRDASALRKTRNQLMGKHAECETRKDRGVYDQVNQAERHPENPFCGLMTG